MMRSGTVADSPRMICTMAKDRLSGGSTWAWSARKVSFIVRAGVGIFRKVWATIVAALSGRLV
jgi:hypothetical protein